MKGKEFLPDCIMIVIKNMMKIWKKNSEIIRIKIEHFIKKKKIIF
jgi:hypothetical protein